MILICVVLQGDTVSSVSSKERLPESAAGYLFPVLVFGTSYRASIMAIVCMDKQEVTVLS